MQILGSPPYFGPGLQGADAIAPADLCTPFLAFQLVLLMLHAPLLGIHDRAMPELLLPCSEGVLQVPQSMPCNRSGSLLLG